MKKIPFYLRRWGFAPFLYVFYTNPVHLEQKTNHNTVRVNTCLVQTTLIFVWVRESSASKLVRSTLITVCTCIAELSAKSDRPQIVYAQTSHRSPTQYRNKWTNHRNIVWKHFKHCYDILKAPKSTAYSTKRVVVYNALHPWPSTATQIAPTRTIANYHLELFI